MKVLPVILRPAPAPWRAPVLDRRHGLFLALGWSWRWARPRPRGGRRPSLRPGDAVALDALADGGFVFNIAISLLAMAIGTVMGVLLGLGRWRRRPPCAASPGS